MKAFYTTKQFSFSKNKNTEKVLQIFFFILHQANSLCENVSYPFAATMCRLARHVDARAYKLVCFEQIVEFITDTIVAHS